VRKKQGKEILKIFLENKTGPWLSKKVKEKQIKKDYKKKVVKIEGES